MIPALTIDDVMKLWAMDSQPTIKPMLQRRQKNWAVVLEEVWPPEIINKSSSSHALDTRVAWVVEELTKWQGVRRLAWDMWYFDDKRTAEKFLTLYYMIWDR
jgi:hypothetical protein